MLGLRLAFSIVYHHPPPTPYPNAKAKHENTSGPGKHERGNCYQAYRLLNPHAISKTPSKTHAMNHAVPYSVQKYTMSGLGCKLTAVSSRGQLIPLQRDN